MNFIITSMEVLRELEHQLLNIILKCGTKIKGRRGIKWGIGPITIQVHKSIMADFQQGDIVTQTKYLAAIEAKNNIHYEKDGYGSYAPFIKWAKQPSQKGLNNVFFLNEPMEKSGSNCCLSFVQQIDNLYFATSRSCDFSLGFWADLKMLIMCAFYYQKSDMLYWTINNLHIYDNNLEAHKTNSIFQFDKKNFKLNLRK